MKPMKDYRKPITVVAFLILLVGMMFVLPHDDVFAVPTDLTTGDFESWAWIGIPNDQNVTEGILTSSTLGFIHLNCDSWGTCTSSTYPNYPNVTIDVETGNVDGWAWIGTTDTSTGYSLGWLNFDPDPLADATYADTSCTAPNYFPAPPCNTAQIDTSNQQSISGWARFETLAQYGDTMLGTTNHNNDWGWVLLRGENSSDSDEFGVLYRDGHLDGWAYSGGGSLPSGSYTNAAGFGWINFSAYGSGSTTGPVVGYLSTERGNVYSGGGITNPSGTLSPSQYNATFILLSSGGTGSIVNFNSELLGEGNITQEDASTMYLPDSTHDYENQLGSLEIDKLTTVVSGSENIYGDEVVALTSFATLSGDEALDGKVILVDDGSSTEYTISDAITFINGTSLGADGSGLIIVDGNLRIDANLYYNNTALTDIKNLASVAWIVRGNLTIGENVSQAVGSFFVIGDVTNDGTNDGVITTEATSASQLVIYGLLMGRSFNFERTYEGVFGNDEPAELIYYDGRILSNTPPGLRDFASVLPIISSE